jgi:predicted nucleic acid-binding protein
VNGFADTSAIVKLYADEAGHSTVRAFDHIIVSQIVRVELPAAVWRKHRMGELRAEAARGLTDAFEADYYGTDDDDPRFAVVAVTPAVLDDAASLCATRGLRAYDAVHLSSAIAARRADDSAAGFAVFDASLRAAAAAEGFQLVPGNDTSS